MLRDIRKKYSCDIFHTKAHAIGSQKVLIGKSDNFVLQFRVDICFDRIGLVYFVDKEGVVKENSP